MCVEPRCSYFYSWRNSHNSKFMYLSKASRVYKVIFVLLVVIVACAVELLFGLHQDLHYTVFLWILSSFFPTKISWSSVYVLWDAVWGGAADSSNLRVFFIYTSAFFLIKWSSTKMKPLQWRGFWVCLWGKRRCSVWEENNWEVNVIESGISGGIYLKNGIIQQKSEKDLENGK